MLILNTCVTQKILLEKVKNKVSNRKNKTLYFLLKKTTSRLKAFIAARKQVKISTFLQEACELQLMKLPSKNRPIPNRAQELLVKRRMKECQASLLVEEVSSKPPVC